MARTFTEDEFAEESPRIFSEDDFSSEEGEPSGPERTSALETIARSGRQGATYGLSDEAIGATQAGGDALNPVLESMGITNPTVKSFLKTSIGLPVGATRNVASLLAEGKLPEDYKGERNIERRADALAAASNPKTAIAANIAGTMANPLSYIGGGGAVPKGGYLSKIGQGFAGGFKSAAPIGALAGLGGSEGETPGELLGDVAIGTGVAGLFGGVGGALGQALSPKNLASLAAKKTLQEADLPDTTLRKMAEFGPKMPYEQKIESIGQSMLDEGLIGKSNLPAEKVNRAALLKQSGAQKIDAALDAISSNKIENFDNVSIIDALKSKYQHLLPEEGRVISELESKLRSQGEGPLPPSSGRVIRQLIDDEINYNSMTDPKIKGNIIRDAKRMVSNELNRSIDEAGKTLGRPDLLPTFLEGNKQYSLGSNVEKAFKKQVRAEFRPERGKVGEFMTQIPIARKGFQLLGHMEKAVTPGPSFIDNLSKGLQQGKLGKFSQVITEAMQRGPAAAAAANHVLTQNSQEYRDMMRQLNNQESNNEGIQ